MARVPGCLVAVMAARQGGGAPRHTYVGQSLVLLLELSVGLEQRLLHLVQVSLQLLHLLLQVVHLLLRLARGEEARCGAARRGTHKEKKDSVNKRCRVAAAAAATAGLLLTFCKAFSFSSSLVLAADNCS